VPGIGFAIGQDRLVEVLPEAFRRRVLHRPTVAVLPVGRSSHAPATKIAREIAMLGVMAPTEVTGRSLKAGLKWATKIGASVAIIVGEREVETRTAVVRDLERGEQAEVPFGEVATRVASLLAVGGQVG
jgi:histidyl-tRNA synthetase